MSAGQTEPMRAAIEKAMNELIFCIGEGDDGPYIHDSALPVLNDLWQAALASQQGPEWQPIETAPKDGTNILVCVAGLDRSVGEAFWWENDRGHGGWQCWDGENHRRTVYLAPTHWRPMLAAAPAADREAKWPTHL